MANFPTSAEQLGTDELTDYLRASGHLSKGRVIAAEHAIIGGGKMGDNARYQLRYEGEAGARRQHWVAKFPAADETARAMAGAQGAYYTEVMFYRQLAPQTTMRLPAVYASELSDDKTSFLLLMEDLSPASPGSALVGESRANAELALAEAAKLAAAFYGAEGLGQLDYVMTAARDDGGAFGQALMEQSWPGFLDRFGHGLSRECIAFGERYVRGHSHFVTRFEGPRTIAHGDFRNENILFGRGTAATVDWQTTSESSVLTDAAYFLGGSLETEQRRAWERDLVEGYRVALDAAGVSLDSARCWEQYREFSMHGLMITVLGASFSSPDPRGDKMFLAMAQRHLQHCIDMDAGEFLPA